MGRAVLTGGDVMWLPARKVYPWGGGFLRGGKEGMGAPKV